MPDDLVALRLLVVREAARTPLYTYVDRVDAGDLEAVGDLFCPDGTYDILGTEHRGPAAIVGALRTALVAFDRTSHHVSNPLIAIDDAGARLSASLYAYHAYRGTGDVWHFWGRYTQRLVPRREERLDEGWAIAHMALVGIASDPPGDPAAFTGHPDRRPVEPP